MHPSDYRRDYSAYHSAAERQRYDSHAGMTREPDLRAVEDRYADLWTAEAVEDLRRSLEETPEQFGTERAGLRALVGAAESKHAGLRAADVTEELKRCAAANFVEWGGGKILAADVPDVIASETDDARRRELARRWEDASGRCEDLRAARLEALSEATRGVGREGRRALYESFTGADVGRLAAGAELFLERTESVFMSALARWSARALPPGTGREHGRAEEFFFGRASHLDAYFGAGDFPAVYKETLAGLGVRVESQKNLRVDSGERAGKSARPACFAVQPPGDVRLVVDLRRGGVIFYRHAFREGGRAQMFAWASAEQAARHPEFVYHPDGATGEGHALLLSSLFRDAGWVGAHRGVRATEAAEVVRGVALVELYEARRECAALKYALSLDAAGDARSAQLAEEYVSGFRAATGFRHDASTRLLDADADFGAARSLRARLFAAGFAEQLRGRHGRRWYLSRGAGDELIDVWNTAARHSVEELARLVWGGELGFELLAEDLTGVLERVDGV
ncbi:MAG TPA: hypothetical protein VGX48_02130 [Pyrinomonadaceae bacterium]|jgi:hypothetical protein|nr:hypothetical protein [Pyrinomonadaceae bacterium]